MKSNGSAMNRNNCPKGAVKAHFSDCQSKKWGWASRRLPPIACSTLSRPISTSVVGTEAVLPFAIQGVLPCRSYRLNRRTYPDYRISSLGFHVPQAIGIRPLSWVANTTTPHSSTDADLCEPNRYGACIDCPGKRGRIAMSFKGYSLRTLNQAGRAHPGVLRSRGRLRPLEDGKMWNSEPP